MKSEIIDEFNLPGYVKGKTFAEASKAIDRKFKDREDNFSEATKQELLGRLAEAQEHLKMKEDVATQANSFPVGGLVSSLAPAGAAMGPSAATQLAQSGAAASSELADMPLKATGTPGAGFPAAGALGAASTALELGQMAFGKTGIDTTGASGRQEGGNQLGMAASGALKGAQAGMAFGPWGAAIGGAIGIGAGLIGAGKRDKEAVEADRNAAYIENNQFSNDFSTGGPVDPNKKLNGQDVKNINANTGLAMNESLVNRLFERTSPNAPNLAPNPINFGKYKDVGYFEMTSPEGDRPMITNTAKNPHNAHTIKQVERELRDLNPGVDFGLKFNRFDGGGKVSTVNELTQQGKIGDPGLIKWAPTGPPTLGINSGLGDMIGKASKFLGKNYDSILNAAPIATNALQLAQLEKADPVSYNRLDARYKSQQVDERSLENRVQNEGTNATRALANATNGSAGALRSNIIGSQLAKTNALSDAYLKANQMNQEDNRFGQQFNQQQNMVNQRTSMMETNERRMDDAAYENNKSMLLSNLGTNIGDFGKQQMNKRMAIEATDYGWDGQYYVNSKDGRKLTPEQYEKLYGVETKKKQKTDGKSK